MEKTLNKNKAIDYIKGVSCAVLISIVGVLVLAFIYRLTGIGDFVIKIINQVIKVVSIFVGTMVCTKNDKTKGLLKGGIVGFFYTLVTYLVFSLLSSTFSIQINFVYDLLFGIIMGSICGVMCVNSQKK